MPLEVINWRVVASGPRPQMNIRLDSVHPIPKNARKGSRLAFFPEGGGYVETTIYDRYALRAGFEFSGPAIVEERESTLIIGAHGQDAMLVAVAKAVEDMA